MSVVARVRRPLALPAFALALSLVLILGAALVPSPAASGPVPRLEAAEAQSGPRIPSAPDRWATDQAGFLSRQAVERLDARLEAYERQTGHQVLVWIGRTIGGDAALEDWAVRTFEAWKVGRKGIDDGLVLFILAEDQKIRIEVGYGLEDKVPDIYAFRVIDNILVPGIRAGRADEAVDAAVTALIGYISGDAKAAGEAPTKRRGQSAAKSIFGGIVLLFLIVLFITNPSFALWLLISMISGGRGGGGGGWGGGGGGGFGGGGGRSGGGGASGGW